MQKAPSLAQVKKELQVVPHNKLVDLVCQLAKFNKLNKELITFQVFDADNPEEYLQLTINEMESYAHQVAAQYWFNQRKVLRKANKLLTNYAKVLANKELELRLKLGFLNPFYEIIRKDRNCLDYIVINQLQRIELQVEKLIAGLHEDLQYEYIKQFKEIKLP